MEAAGPYWFYIAALIRIVVVFLGLSLLVAYLVYAERKILAHMQVRLGPMRVGPHGLLQPIADGLKLLLKEDIIPAGADRALFWLAPVISVIAAFTGFALVPFGPNFAVTDVNVGLLFLIGISSLGILGIILGGWASNSHYPLLGALRSSAQLVSYEVALGFSLVSGLLLAGSLSMQKIVEAQDEQGIWFVFLQPVAFLILLVAAIAETNRNPFDLPEAESELVGGFHTEYSGFRFSLYFLAEYAAMVLVSSVAVTLFLGGWLRPFADVPVLDTLTFMAPLLLFGWAAFWCVQHARRLPADLEWRWQRLLLWLLAAGAAFLVLVLLVPSVPGLPGPFPFLTALQGPFWFMVKVCALLYTFIWFRGTFPRYRFDQLMSLGWQFLIPLSIVNIIFCGLGIVVSQKLGWGYWASMWLATAATAGVAVPLARWRGMRTE